MVSPIKTDSRLIVQRQRLLLTLAGILLTGLCLGITVISLRFKYDANPIDRPAAGFVALLVAAGVVYYIAVWRVAGSERRNFGILLTIMVTGVILRLVMVPSTPILDTDFYRGLWDGAVTANGMNPYRYSVKDVLEGAEGVPERLVELADASEQTAERVNHPGLRTIHPPLAQAVFAISYLVLPWNLVIWKLLLMVFDIIAFVIMFSIFQNLKLPLACLAIYWWNPLLIMGIYNSGHMEMIMLPFLAGSLLLAMRKNYPGAAATLALAMGVEFWPVILLPVVLRPLFKEPRKLAGPIAVFALITIALFLPMMIAGLGPVAGVTACIRQGQANGALFLLIFLPIKLVVRLLSISPDMARIVARGVALVLVLVFSASIIRTEENSPHKLAQRFLAVTAAVFFLSPVPTPWHFVWMLPFLAVRPRQSLLLATALLPLYYLRFLFETHDMTGVFDYGIVWIEFAPVLFLLAREWRGNRNSTSR